VRRVLFSAFNIGLATQPQVRGVCIALLAVLCLIMQLLVKPYKNDALNAIESASLLLHIALANIVMPWPKPYPLSIEVIVFLLIFIPSLFFFGWKVFTFFGAQCCSGVVDAPAEEAQEGGGAGIAGPAAIALSPISSSGYISATPRVHGLHGAPPRPQQQQQQQQQDRDGPAEEAVAMETGRPLSVFSRDLDSVHIFEISADDSEL